MSAFKVWWSKKQSDILRNIAEENKERNHGVVRWQEVLKEVDGKLPDSHRSIPKLQEHFKNLKKKQKVAGASSQSDLVNPVEGRSSFAFLAPDGPSCNNINGPQRHYDRVGQITADPIRVNRVGQYRDFRDRLKEAFGGQEGNGTFFPDMRVKERTTDLDYTVTVEDMECPAENLGRAEIIGEEERVGEPIRTNRTSTQNHEHGSIEEHAADMQKRSEQFIMDMVRLHNANTFFERKLKLDVVVVDDDEPARGSSSLNMNVAPAENVAKSPFKLNSGPSPKTGVAISEEANVWNDDPYGSEVASDGSAESNGSTGDASREVECFKRSREFPSEMRSRAGKKFSKFSYAQWEKILHHASQHYKAVQLGDFSPEQWKQLATQLEIQTANSGDEILEDFFSHAVPNLKKCLKDGEKYKLPLLEPDRKLFMAIYHSIEKVGLAEIKKVIEGMKATGIIEEHRSTQSYLTEFVNSLLSGSKDQFNTNESDFALVKRLIMQQMLSVMC